MATTEAINLNEFEIDDFAPPAAEEIPAKRESITLEIKSHPGCIAAMQLYGPCGDEWKGWISVGMKNRPGGHVDKESQPTVWPGKEDLVKILGRRIADWFLASDLSFGKEVAAEVLSLVGAESEVPTYTVPFLTPDNAGSPVTVAEIDETTESPSGVAEAVSDDLGASGDEPEIAETAAEDDSAVVLDIPPLRKQLNLGAYEDLSQLEDEIIEKRAEGREAEDEYLSAKESAKDLKKRWECKRQELDELCDQLQEVRLRINNDLRNPTPCLPFSSPQDTPAPATAEADPVDGDTVVMDPDGWRDTPVRVLKLTEALLDRLEESEFTTLGLLEDARASGALSKTKGIGKGKLTLIEDAILAWLGEWRAKNPTAEPPADLIDGKWERVAYKSGSLARADGVPITKNPHPDGSLLHGSWDAGWCLENSQLAEKKPPEDPEVEAYRLGCEAAAKDEEAINNPHKAGTGLWHAWDRGWQETVANIDLADFDDEEEGDVCDTLEDELDALLEDEDLDDGGEDD